MNQTFSISPAEIHRRVTAFASLLISFGLGLSLTILIAIPISWLELTVLAGYSVIAYGSYRLTRNFFQTYNHQTITVNDAYVLRKTSGTQDKLRLSELKEIHTLYTKRNQLRQVKLCFIGGQRLSFDGLANFDEVLQLLTQSAPSHTRFYSTKEPLDYDHPVFYPILGICLALMMRGIISLAPILTSGHLVYVSGIIALYLCSLGIYFLVALPLTKQYGSTYQLLDYRFGIGLIVSAIIVGWLGIARFAPLL